MKNKIEFAQALEQLVDEKGISRSVVFDAIREGFKKAFEKFFDTEANAIVDIDEENFDINLYVEFLVVETVDDDWLEISLEDAKKIQKDIKIGDTFRKPIEFNEEFSRMAVSQVVQIFQQRIKLAEREIMYDKFIKYQEKLITAKVLGMNEAGNYIFDVMGTNIPLLFPKSIPNETFYEGEYVDLFVEELSKENKTSQVIISRTAPMFLSKLIEKEIPEVKEGKIIIKGVSRQPGVRAKVAVVSFWDNIDAIGSIVGNKGSRINKISKMINDEKIDLVNWDEDITTYIANAMAPVRVISINQITDNEYDIIVPDQQFSLAIGKKGIAAKLIANLINMRVNILSLSNAIEEKFDVLWNGNITQSEVENSDFINKTNQQKAKSQKKSENEFKTNSNDIDLDSLYEFQNKVTKENEDLKTNDTLEEEHKENIDINNIDDKSNESVEKQIDNESKNTDDDLSLEEINENLDFFNSILDNEEDEEENDTQEESLDDNYEDYYE